MTGKTTISQILMPSRKTARILALFACAFLLLNFPFLGMVGKDLNVHGIPVLYVYLFLVWLFLIILIRWLLTSKKK